MDGGRTRTAQWAQALEAAAALSVAKLVVGIAPFRAIAALASWRGRRNASSSGASMPSEIAQAVERASRRLPVRTVCFHEGLAAQWMLRRRGAHSFLHYGIKQANDRLSAHVWVTLNGRIIVGEAASADHACVATFPPAGR